MLNHKFGRLTVRCFAGRDKASHKLWNCICECGQRRIVQQSHLKSGDTLSCGCLGRERSAKRLKTHGESGRKASTEYRTWYAMCHRCENPNAANFRHYGGRGIKVSKELRRFKDFLTVVGRKPSSDHSLDRIQVNGNYEPGNVRWATGSEQARNKRNSRANQNLAEVKL